MATGKQNTPQRGGTPQDDLMAALQEATAQHQKRLKDDKKKPRFLWMRGAPGIIKTALIVLLVLVIILVADGMRREAGEMSASISSVTGTVTLVKGGTAAPQPARANMELGNKDVIATGAESTATVVFPDGSAVQVEPASEFEVRLLDFSRGTQRDRSFMVRAGSIVARVSKAFGAQSQATICTPTAVAAARGTGFRVLYDPAKKQTFVGVVDGTVEFKTSLGQMQLPTGSLVAAQGYQAGGPQALTAAQNSRIGTSFQQMGQFEKEPGFLQNLEYALNTALDPFLQIVGLAPGSWSYSTCYAARRATCQEALRRLQNTMVSIADENLPDAVSLTTMEELHLDSREKERILETFHGHMLESYRKTGTGRYEIVVRARDKDRTRYMLNEIGVQQLK